MYPLKTTALLVVSLSFSLYLTGCSMSGTPVSDASAAQTAPINGIVHGGRQPVSNSTVTLWAAGNAGYGSAATQLAQTTTASDGTFSFGPGSGNTYSCPATNSTTASQLVYVTAVGGQPTTGVTNSQAALMAGLGDCLTIQSSNPTVNITEATTIASMTAMQQFFTPSASGLGSFGTSATNAIGLSNAIKTISTMINMPYGTAWATTTVSGNVSGYSTNPVVTITPEQNKINTEADILAACVNSSGTGSAGCTTLFGNVSNTTPKDTLQAAYYIATNPTSTTSTSTIRTCTTGSPQVMTTSTICNLYGLVTATAPFAPSLASAPTDWTIGVTYGSASSQIVSATAVYLLNQPEHVAIDSLGNVWILNSNTSTTGAAGNSVAELSPVGVPEAQIFTAAGTLSGPNSMAVDPNNNIFVSNYGPSAAGHTVIEFNGTTLATSTLNLVSTGPDALAIDGSGDVYVADYGGSSGNGDLEVIASGSAAGTTATQIATGVSVGSNSSLAIDSYNDFWLTNNASTATTQFICSQNPCQATSTIVGGQTAPRSVAIDHSNNIWLGNASSTAGTVSEITATTTTSMTAATGSPFSVGGLLNPFRAMFGGLNNQWITSYASGAGTVTELNGTGGTLSPSIGYAHTYSGAQGLAIDASGNVWVGNYSAAAPSGFITEIVGASGPSITPFSANLPVMAGGANTVGMRP
jgi:hypothetical protein